MNKKAAIFTIVTSLLWGREAAAAPGEQPAPAPVPELVPAEQPPEAETEIETETKTEIETETAVTADAPGPEAPAATAAIAPAPAPANPAGPGDAQPDAKDEGPHLLGVSGDLGKQELAASVAVYGMVVVNAVFDSGSVGPTGESPAFAALGSRIGDGLPNDGQFLITPRQTKFGIKANLQMTDKVDIKGMVEVDFFGLHENVGPTAVVQPGVRLRLAKLDVGNDRFRFIAGQDWSVVTPRLATSLSHMVVAAHTFGGAVWGRLPQLTFVYRQPVGRADSKLGAPAVKLQVSAVRNFSGDGFGGGITRFDKVDPGTLSKLPVGQARVSFESKQFSVGAAGHIGRETYQLAELDGMGGLTTSPSHVATWMASADVNLATKWVWVSGQGYYGSNINMMLSGQGVRYDLWTDTMIDPTDPRVGELREVVGLRGAGGWAEIGAKLGTDKVKAFASGGADVGRESEVAVGKIWLNVSILGGVVYAPIPLFDMSLEYQRLMSYYRAAMDTAPAEQRRGVNDFISANFRFKF